MTGRKEERKRITALLDSPQSEFLAITGRRRVGKTFLVDSLLADRYVFSLTGIQNGDTSTQLTNFAVKLAEYDGSYSPQALDNWQQAFLRLKGHLNTLAGTEKHVIFIDELPWVSTPRSGFIQMLAHFWNDYLSKRTNFLLVICGSATSWITKRIINDPGGLHNRVRENIHLNPFTLSETRDFLIAKGLRYTTQELARIYMSLGGIPFYLEGLRKGESFAVGIERLCFAPTGLLRNEYNNLYRALFNNAELHQKIVGVLANKHYGLSRQEILKQIDRENSGSYQRAIEELLLSDFITELVPVGRKKRGLIYRLTDEYSMFYHRFIKPNTRYTPGIWQQLSSSQTYKIWAGYAFENLCLKHVEQIKYALGIRGVYAEVSSLYVPANELTPGFQIDLILERKDDSINLFEIKFHASPYLIGKKEAQLLSAKLALFKAYTQTKKQVFLSLLTNQGVVDNEYARDIVDVTIKLEDLLE